MGMFCEKCGRRYPAGGLVCRHDGQMLAKDPRLGRTVAEHTLVRLLRPHPLGAVYAVTGPDGATRAMAWYDRSTASDPVEETFVATLARLRALADNPRLPTLAAGGRVDGDPFLVSDGVTDPPLGGLRRLLPTRVSRIGAGVAEGLAAAAAQRVPHGALTPACVFLGEGDAVHLEDFGVRTLGTIEDDDFPPWAYAAPEDDPAHPTSAGDVYALGVILYELVVGENPFRALFDPPETRRRHQTRTPPALRDRLTGVPEGFEALLLAMLEKAPEARPPVAAVAVGFAAIAEGRVPPPWRPGEAPPPLPEPTPAPPATEPVLEPEPVVSPPTPPTPEPEPAPEPEPEREVVTLPPMTPPAPQAPARPIAVEAIPADLLNDDDDEPTVEFVPPPTPPPPPVSRPQRPGRGRPTQPDRVVSPTPEPGARRGVLMLAVATALLIAVAFGGIAFVMLAPVESNPERFDKAPDLPEVAKRAAPVQPGDDLQAQVDSAADGAILRVEGEHAGGLTFSRDVTLTGAPDHPATLVLDRPLRVTGGAVRLAHINIVWTGDAGDAIDATGGALTLDRVDLHGGVGNGLRVHKAARVTIRDSHIHDTKKGAVFAFDTSQVEVRDTRIQRSGSASLEIAGKARFAATGLTVIDSGGAGFFASDEARLRVVSSDVTNSRLAAVEIAEKAEAEIIDNDLHDGRSSGVLVRGEPVSVLLARNRVRANALAGVEVKGNARPEVLLNTFTAGNGTAIFVHSGAGGGFSRNTITGHRLAGIELNASGAVMLRENVIEGGQSTGIYAHDGAQATVHGGAIKKSGKAGVKVAEGSTVSLHGVVVAGSHEAGIFFYEGSHGEVIGCTLQGNRLAGVEVREASDPVVRGNVIKGNLGHGIYVHTGGAGLYERNRVQGNGGQPIRVKEAKITRRHNDLAP